MSMYKLDFHIIPIQFLVILFNVFNLPFEVNSVNLAAGIKKDVKPGWVRFCGNSDEYFDVFANQCPGGLFWQSDFPQNAFDCICTRGAWRRSNEWCSNENVQRFTQGDTTCFSPEGEKISAMYYLGDRYSAWDSGTPILLTSYTSGFPIPYDEYNQKWPLPTMKHNDPGIIISRPRDDWTVEDQNSPDIRLCLRAPPPTFDDTNDGVFIYNVSMLFDGQHPDSKLIFSRTCFSWEKDDGKTWYEVIGESLDDKNMVMPRFDNSTGTARKLCKSGLTFVQKCPKNMDIHYVYFMKNNCLNLPDACKKCMSYPIPHAPTTDVYGKPIKPAERKTIEDLKHVGVLTSEINLQTERLGLYWANRLLRDETDYVKENLQEVEILTKAAIMAYGTCDLNYIPKQFYQYFLIMFRRLLSESFKKYAPMAPINPEYYMKIEELLEKCKERTKPIQFIVDDSCPPMYEKYKSMNGTDEPIPNGNDYDARPAKHDYLLEFIWRLKSFLHYNCFPEFKEDSVLHDLVQNQLESLFTEDILLRWFNPSKAFRMYEHIFKMHVDLQTTMFNFERCVKVVHEMSKFPVWLKRPIDQPHRNEQSIFSRKKRQAGNELDSETLSLESEYADMALENIREKRTSQEMNENQDYGDEEFVPNSESSEAFYTDSSEGGKHPQPSDGVWNKFKVRGSKNFQGACIESISKFTKMEKKNMDECW